MTPPAGAGRSLAAVLPRILARGDGFVLVAVGAPSRGVAAEAAREARRLVRRAGRPALDGDGEGLFTAAEGAVVVLEVTAPTWAARERTLLTWNRLRDPLAARRVSLVLVLLDADLGRVGACIPDLWSVRTDLLRHDAAAPLPAGPPPQVGGAPAALAPGAAGMAARLDEELAWLHARDPLSGKGVRPRFLDLYQAPPVALTDAGGEALDGPPEARPALLLLGAPGAGKTWFLQRTMLDRLQAGFPCALRRALALDAAGFGPDDLDGAAALVARTQPRALPAGLVPELFVDGWDELPDPAARLRLLHGGLDLLRAGRIARLWVASRPEGLGAGEATPEGLDPELRGLPRARLRGLDRAQVEAQVARWVGLLPGARRAAARATLARATGLRDGDRGGLPPTLLAERPLILALVCSLAISEGGPGPQGGVEAVLEGLLARLLQRGADGTWRAEDLRDAARRLAWALVQAREGRAAPAPDPAAVEALRSRTELLAVDEGGPRFLHGLLRDQLAAERMLDLAPLDDPATLAGWLVREVEAAGGPPARIRARTALPFVRLLARWAPDRLRALLQALPGAEALDLVGDAFGAARPRSLEPWLQGHLAGLRAARADADVGVRAEAARTLARLGALPEAGAWAPVAEGWALARWPLSAAELGAFLDAGGAQDRRWWDAAGRRAWAAHGDRAPTPEGWRILVEPLPGDVALGIDPHLARALVRWLRAERQEPALDLLPAGLWPAALDAGPPASLDGWAPRAAPPRPPVPPLGASGVAPLEDLGVLVREWLAPEPGAAQPFGGRCWADGPERPVATVERYGRGGRREWWRHGLRLALRPPGVPARVRS